MSTAQGAERTGHTGPPGSADLERQAVRLAEEILQSSRQHASAADREIAETTQALVDDPAAKQFTLAIVDRVLRIRDERRAAEQLRQLLRRRGVPRGFSLVDRGLLYAGALAARLAPGTVMPMIRRKVRAETSHVIISSRPENFDRYLQRRERQGIRVNLNQLGEAVLGHREADRRLEAYLDRLSDPRINYVSVKVSSIASHISLTGYDATLKRIGERLRRLYRAALQPNGKPNKFVNLDMEEYRDLHLTVDLFRSLLEESEFRSLSAGIVLQAYLPDSYAVLTSLTEWARWRVASGGADIKVRLVKGANLAMEQVEASLHGWPQAPYETKVESDANYKRMLNFALRRENADAVRIGLASHNLFDIAYGMQLAEQRGVSDRLELEMLEGMAQAQSKELCRRTGDMLVYSPLCDPQDFESAIAYLVRRFDENTQEGSFLKSIFGLRVDSEAWHEQRRRFGDACRLAFSDSLSATPRRDQDRSRTDRKPMSSDQPFGNAPDTDFSLPANRDWIRRVVDHEAQRECTTIPIQVGGQFVETTELVEGVDPSCPGVVRYRYGCGRPEDVDRALDCARQSLSRWDGLGLRRRAEILRNFAGIAENQRGSTIGRMLSDTGKAVAQSDPEVSEAIDFAEYYARSLDDAGFHDATESTAAGVVVVTPPWNFPYAIPAGGVAAALMAGNPVILKPAPESVGTAWLLANQFWQAGVPKDVLQFLPLADGPVGESLICDARTEIVVLTGGFETAKRFLDWRPDLRLCAETSGKNSMIISSTADLDLAVKDLVYSSFGHAGQKCSATSLALVDRDVYDSELFRRQLADAASSLHTGSAWDLGSEVTPLIRPPGEDLMRALTRLDPGESWLVRPRKIDGNPRLWSPGIKLGVVPGSWFHRTECFGPVLGLMPVESLQQAIEIQNDNEFGLTGGLHALDRDEIERWRDQVQVGNAYVNRSTTGAIVNRQPFGGWKHSSVGPGAKAGGPNYVAAFRDWSLNGTPHHRASLPEPLHNTLKRYIEAVGDSDSSDWLPLAESYHYWWSNHFSQQHDPWKLHGEANHFRYRPERVHCLRLPASSSSTGEVALAWVACRLAGIELQVSVASRTDWAHSLSQWLGVECRAEAIDELADRVSTFQSGTLRMLTDLQTETLNPRRLRWRRLLRQSCRITGRIGWLGFLREQSVSETMHRHGNLIASRE